ncbi:hypothetical protein D3C71_2107480 [compost metagenome]
MGRLVLIKQGGDGKANAGAAADAGAPTLEGDRIKQAAQPVSVAWRHESDC